MNNIGNQATDGALRMNELARELARRPAATEECNPLLSIGAHGVSVLFTGLESLDKSLRALEMRLSRVLSAATPETSSKNPTGPSDNCSPLTSELREATAHLGRMSAMVDSMISRVDF